MVILGNGDIKLEYAAEIEAAIDSHLARDREPVAIRIAEIGRIVYVPTHRQPTGTLDRIAMTGDAKALMGKLLKTTTIVSIQH